MLRWLGMAKVYAANSLPYVTLVNYVMLVLTWKQVYGLGVKAWVVVAGGVAALLVIGYLDYALIMRHQIEYHNRQNDVREKLDELLSIFKENEDAE